MAKRYKPFLIGLILSILSDALPCFVAKSGWLTIFVINERVMWIEMLKSKIHRAVVTDANLNYKGSIRSMKIYRCCRVESSWKSVGGEHNNGERFETYVIRAKGARELFAWMELRLERFKWAMSLLYDLCTDDTRRGRHFEPVIVNLDGKTNQTVR
jgi:aspartate 1-decarboxylase